MRILIRTLLSLILATYGFLLFGQRAVFFGQNVAASGSNTPTRIVSTCVANPGAAFSINTTGANFMVGVEYYFQAGSAAVVTSTLSGSATLLTEHAVTGDTASRIYYWTNPTVGADTLSFGGNFLSTCIWAYSGMVTVSVLDAGTDNGAGPGTANCTTGSITLSTNDLLISGAAVGTAGTFPSAPTGFTAEPTIGGINFTGGSNYGGAGATRVQNGGTSNPTWTTPGDSACSIAAFKIM